jgi:hypothetical protein
MALLVKAINNGLHVVNVTVRRKRKYGSIWNEYRLEDGNFRKDITTEAAITKLMYLLSQNAKKTLKLFLKLLYEAKYYNNVILLSKSLF